MVDFSGIGSILSGASALGGLFGGGGLSDRKSMALQYEYQTRANKEVLQNQLQWKTQDAKAAGIHPLYAIGAPSVSFSPSFSGIGSGGGDSAMSRISQAGQGISRAVNAYADGPMRRRIMEQEVEMNDINIKDAQVRLAKNASDLAITQSGATPGLNGPFTSFVPSENTHTRRFDSATEANKPAPATKEFYNRDGSITVWPSKDAKAATEDSMYEWEHAYRNRFVPYWRSQGDSVRRAWNNVWWNPRTHGKFYSK